MFFNAEESGLRPWWLTVLCMNENVCIHFTIAIIQAKHNHELIKPSLNFLVNENATWVPCLSPCVRILPCCFEISKSPKVFQNCQQCVFYERTWNYATNMHQTRAVALVITCQGWMAAGIALGVDWSSADQKNVVPKAAWQLDWEQQRECAKLPKRVLLPKYNWTVVK